MQSLLKYLRPSSLFVFICFLGSAKAQNSEQLYRVHFKDSTFYTGIITERVEEDYLMLVTLGGNEARIGFENIERIEKIEGSPSAAIYQYLVHKAKEKKRKYREERQKYLINGARYRGYFALIQYCTGYVHMGVTTVHGYKFNQYLSVGAGLGFDGVDRPISFRPNRFSAKHDNAMGMHFPFFVHLNGDILKRRATPYYAIEIGYAYVLSFNSLIDLETRAISPHGVFVAPSFGVKFNSSKRYHTNVGIKLTYRARQMTFRELPLDQESNLYHLEFNKVMTSSWFLGLTVVQGF